MGPISQGGVSEDQFDGAPGGGIQCVRDNAQRYRGRRRVAEQVVR
jgi:hypothetical protein